MKTYITILLSLTSIFTTRAQSAIPDFTFENWEIASVWGVDYNTVSGWGSTNINNVMFGEEEMVEKTTNAFAGQYAIKLINKPNNNQMPAAVMSMNPLPNDEFNTRFPLTEKITALHGYYKYEPIETDTFSIMMTLFKEGSPIAYGEFTKGGDHHNYEAFTAPITYAVDQTPDSASITIWVSRDDFKEGSVLTLDNFSYNDAVTGIGEKTNPSFRCEVSPNPSQGMFTLSYDQLQKGNVKIYVYDLLGHEVKHFATKNNGDGGIQEFPMDCSDLKRGLYLVKLQQPGAERTLRISIQ